MKILLTNDDGILAPGLAALAKEFSALGDVAVVAPVTEQSGVGHGLTFLSAIKYREVFLSGHFWGWAIEGTPADCVRMGFQALCVPKPDIVISGINSGYNAGVNVHYSGTCSAAIEGRFFGVTSFAVSLQSDAPDLYAGAARIARQIVQQILESDSSAKNQNSAPPSPALYNLNIPNKAVRDFLDGTAPQIKYVPTDDRLYGEKLDKGESPFGLPFYWCAANSTEQPAETESDLTALKAGFVTLTPLNFNMTDTRQMKEMDTWNLAISPTQPAAELPEDKMYPEIYIRRMPLKKRK